MPRLWCYVASRTQRLWFPTSFSVSAVNPDRHIPRTYLGCRFCYFFCRCFFIKALWSIMFLRVLCVFWSLNRLSNPESLSGKHHDRIERRMCNYLVRHRFLLSEDKLTQRIDSRDKPNPKSLILTLMMTERFWRLSVTIPTREVFERMSLTFNEYSTFGFAFSCKTWSSTYFWNLKMLRRSICCLRFE